MNVLLLTAHDIAEYDDLRMLTDLGADVFSIGAYTDPANPASVLRPPLDVPAHPELAALCIEQREKHADDPMELWVEGQLHNVVDWAKADLHPDIIEWSDVIVCHHYLESWIVRQWSAIKHKRVIWRTCGQSNASLEETMAKLHDDGLQIIRYSPAEERAFRRLGTWAGQDALIRFGKYPTDYGPWIGDDLVVGNVTQNMAGRGEFCGLTYWLQATRGLPVKPAGLQSEALPGGIGALTYPEMIEYLRHVRTYLYTGTQPASYTLALIEAMMTGVPVVSMGPASWWVPDLFEAAAVDDEWPDHEMPPTIVPADSVFNDPQRANYALRLLLDNPAKAQTVSGNIRRRAIDLFDVAKVGPQWAAFLGLPVRVRVNVAVNVTHTLNGQEVVNVNERVIA